MCKREAKAIERSDFDDVRDLNAGFHLAIIAASENARLIELTKPLITVGGILRTFRHYRGDQMREHMSSHLVMVEALQAGNADWAAHAMRSHLIGAKERVLEDKHRTEVDARAHASAEGTPAGA
jgi:DNA-binding GntR family transcriptional regulator